MNYCENDPEFMERLKYFVMEEIVNKPEIELPNVARYIAVLATLIGCQGTEVYREVLKYALDYELTPVMAREIVYQAVDYLGIGRVMPFLTITNEVFSERKGIDLPLPPQATTTIEDRLEKGVEVQAEIFGERMREAWKEGYINRLLAAQGGCEPQLIAHAKGNMNLGNDKEFLVRVVMQCLPYIGYPRSLNAINCINKAAEM